MFEQIKETRSLAHRNITHQPPAVQQEWLAQMGQQLQGWEQVEDKTVMIQAEVLYHVWAVWEADNNAEGDFLSRDAIAKWGYDFYKWAKCYTKRRAKREPADITIDNKITIYRDWVALQVIEYPQEVFVPHRDDYGQLVNPDMTKAEAWETVSFDPMDCDFGKLLIARGTARKGQMTPEAWSCLRDPHSTAQDLRGALENDRRRSPNVDDFHIEEIEGIIYGCESGHRVPVFQAIFEESQDPLFKRTYCFIMQAAGLRVPLSYQS